MRIEQFRYYDKTLGWKLETISFSDLTLLVGISGVGKTQILRSLLNIKNVAKGRSLNGVEWEIIFSTNEGHCYHWSGEFENKKPLVTNNYELFDDQGATSDDKSEILSETLLMDGKEVVRRTLNEIILNGVKTPKLSPSTSILSLFSQEDCIQPASLSFHRILYSEQDFSHNVIGIRFENLSTKFNTLDKIQESEIGIQLKLALVYKFHPDIFDRIKQRFIDIFPQVTDLRLESIERSDIPFIADIPVLQILETGVSDWISQDRISSGMLRTVFHIAEMYLWPEGTVILIDEFENSLGINCIDVLTEDLLQQNRKLQFILTSHHPYIINNISSKYWKVVCRKGGTVTTRDASSFNISDSNHEAFIKLINSDLYREGIAAA